MSGDPVPELIQGLVGDLTPVRPIPRLRTVVTGVGLLWLAAAALAVAVRGLRPDLPRVLHSDPGFLVIVTGLGLTGLGGVLAALATSIPGRDTVVRLGLALALAGLLLACLVGAALVIRHVGGHPVSCGPGADVACFSVSCLLALPPALGVLAFVSRGSAFRPLLAVLVAVTGTVALGAVLVHLTCPATAPRHVILAHLLAPLGGALLLTLPFHVALERVRRG